MTPSTFAFAEVTAEDLAGAMRAPGQSPMRAATVREISDADIDAFAALLLATAPGKAA